MSEESTEPHETLPPEAEQTDPMAPPGESETEEMDLEDTPPETPPAPAEPPPQAEPGIYRCVGEIAGEHAVLGILTQGEEYDYRQSNDPRVLQAVAAYVELCVLEKV